MRVISGCLALLAGAFVFCPGLAGAAVDTVPNLPAKRPLVAIIDSGIARTAELRDDLVAEYDFGATPARPAFEPRYDHGTMVATILERAAASPVGIVSLRIDDAQGCPQGANPPCQHEVKPIVEAIRKATELGVSAINISLNLKEDPSIVAAVHDAAAKGIQVVMAAGNDGLDKPGNLKLAEAGYPNTILVGALEPNGRPWKGTNRPQAHTPGYRYVWQRGVAVPTVLADGSNAFATGTSFAVPIETARLVAPTPPVPATIALSS